MRIFILNIIPFLLMCFSISAKAQVAVSAQVDSTFMEIGDKFPLHLSVTYPKGAALQSIDLTDLNAIENVDIEGETDWDTTSTGQKILLKKDLIMQVWDSGYYWIPEIPFIIGNNGVSNQYKTNRIPINVASVILQDSVQLADIKDILREQANWRDYLPYVLPFLLFGLAGGLFYWWKKRKALETALPPLEIKLPAHEIALSALTQLKGKKLWQQGEIKRYQSQLTYIIREYLENRYQVPALESTTDEILRSLKQVDFDNNWKEKLQNILQVADLVKFAKAKPPADFHDRVLIEAEDFVIATKVKPVVVAEEIDSISASIEEEPAAQLENKDDLAAQ